MKSIAWVCLAENLVYNYVEAVNGWVGALVSGLAGDDAIQIFIVGPSNSRSGKSWTIMEWFISYRALFRVFLWHFHLMPECLMKLYYTTPWHRYKHIEATYCRQTKYNGRATMLLFEPYLVKWFFGKSLIDLCCLDWWLFMNQRIWYTSRQPKHTTFEFIRFYAWIN